MNAKAKASKNDELIDKIKKDEAAKKEADAQAAKDAERIAKQQEEMDEKSEKPSPELEEAAKKEAERIAAAERDEGDVPVDEGQDKDVGDDRYEKYSKERKEAGEKAFEKLRNIAMSYPRTTPDTHPVFGFGGITYNLGDLRDITNIR